MHFAQSKTHVVLATLKRAASELSSYQRKIFKVDDHMGIAVSGLISDGRSLLRYMRNECLNHRYVSLEFSCRERTIGMSPLSSLAGKNHVYGR